MPTMNQFKEAMTWIAASPAFIKQNKQMNPGLRARWIKFADKSARIEEWHDWYWIAYVLDRGKKFSFVFKTKSAASSASEAFRRAQNTLKKDFPVQLRHGTFKITKLQRYAAREVQDSYAVKYLKNGDVDLVEK